MPDGPRPNPGLISLTPSAYWNLRQFVKFVSDPSTPHPRRDGGNLCAAPHPAYGHLLPRAEKDSPRSRRRGNSFRVVRAFRGSTLRPRVFALIARAARTKFTEPIRGCHSAIHEEVAAGDKRAVSTHEECADRSHFVGSAGSSGRRHFDHASVARAARPGQPAISGSTSCAS